MQNTLLSREGMSNLQQVTCSDIESSRLISLPPTPRSENKSYMGSPPMLESGRLRVQAYQPRLEIESNLNS